MNSTGQSHQTFEKSKDDTSSHGTKANPLECNICLEDSFEPVVTPCGHIYCWSCIYKWFKAREQNNYCPVCNAVISQEKLIPIYSKNEKPGTRYSLDWVDNIDLKPRKHDESIPKRPKPDRQERQRNSEEGNRGNAYNGTGNFFPNMYIGGFGLGNMFFTGVNFNTRNMSFHVALIPMIISIVFSLFMNSIAYDDDEEYYHTSYIPDRNAYPRPTERTTFGNINLMLLLGFLCLGFIIKKIMR